jgi:hypothetical protein
MTNTSHDTEDYNTLSPGELYMRHLKAVHGASDEDPEALFEAYKERLRAAHAAADAPAKHPDERRTPWSAGDDLPDFNSENTR